MALSDGNLSMDGDLSMGDNLEGLQDVVLQLGNMDFKEHASAKQGSPLVQQRITLKPKRRLLRMTSINSVQNNSHGLGDCETTSFSPTSKEFPTFTPTAKTLKLTESKSEIQAEKPSRIKPKLVKEHVGRLKSSGTVNLLGNKIDGLEQAVQVRYLAKATTLNSHILVAPELFRFYSKKTRVMMGLPVVNRFNSN